MNFRPRPKEEPEINLIPFIDVLLVILIFLMLTTTYSKFTELQLKLPVAELVARHRPQSLRWPGLILEVTEDQVVRDTEPASNRRRAAVAGRIGKPDSRRPVVLLRTRCCK